MIAPWIKLLVPLLLGKSTGISFYTGGYNVPDGLIFSKKR